MAGTKRAAPATKRLPTTLARPQMAFLLYVVGLVVFIAGLGWLLTSLGVAAAWVNAIALALLVAGLTAGVARLRIAGRI
jgi:apolipoprotein N-acyltransferase